MLDVNAVVSIAKTETMNGADGVGSAPTLRGKNCAGIRRTVDKQRGLLLIYSSETTARRCY